MLDDMDAVHASLQKEDFDLFIADCRGVSDTALSFVESLRSWQKSLPTFVICDQWELETVIRAIRLGVIDVFSCPLDEKALVAVKLCTGYADPLIHPATGEVLMIPRSIAFENLGQEDFERFYEAALAAVSSHIVPHLRPEDRDRVLAEIVEAWA